MPAQAVVQPTGVDSLGGGSQSARAPVGASASAPLPADGNVEQYGSLSRRPPDPYGVQEPTGAVAMPTARQSPPDAFRVPARLASAGPAVSSCGGSGGAASLGGSAQAAAFGQAAPPLMRQAQSASSLAVPQAQPPAVAPVLSARMSSAPQAMGYAGGWAGSSTGALPCASGRPSQPNPYGAGAAAPWGMACASARGMAMR